MNYPNVSVIIPTYNRAELLPRAIQSVLNQTFKDFELIVVDDCSTDNTPGVVNKFLKKDDRIKYVRLTENSGTPAHPKNIGILNSKGGYIAFLDSDDEWLSRKLEKQINLFKKYKNYRVGLVACNALIFEQRSNSEYLYKIPKYKDVFQKFLVKNFIPSTSSVMVKKDVFGNIGLFDENLKLGEDWDMWIRIAQKYDFDFVPEPLFKYYIHGGNITQTSSADKRIEDLQYILQKYMKYYRMYSKAYSIQMRNLGVCYILGGQILKGKRYFLKSIKLNPLNIKSYIYFCTYGSKFYKMLSYIKNKIKNKFVMMKIVT